MSHEHAVDFLVRKRRRTAHRSLFETGAIVMITEPWHVYYRSKHTANKLHLQHWQDEADENERAEPYIEAEVHDIGVVLGWTRNPVDQARVIGVHVLNKKRDYLIHHSGITVLRTAPVDEAPAPLSIMNLMWASRMHTGDCFLVGSEGDSIAAHACVISVASPIFAVALKSGMQEARVNKIRLPECSAPAVQGLLEFLYLGVLHHPFDTTNMLRLSHTYNILLLAKHIANYAIAAMNVENAAETARLLRDFDRSGTDFTDRILEFWSSNREMMRAVISDV